MSVSRVNFRIDRRGEPEKIRELLLADANASFWSRAREALTGTLALSSVVLLTLALDPRMMPDRSKWIIAGVWTLVAGAFAASVALERLWYRRRDEIAAALGGGPLER